MANDMDAIVIRLPLAPSRGSGMPQAWSPAGASGGARRIDVRSLAAGWCVRAETLEPLIFRRGGHAERQARAMAEAFARLGHDARVAVYDRDNRLAGAIDTYGETAPPPTLARAYPWSH